jgi:hypothetical protein
MFIIVNQTNTNVLFSDLKTVPPLKSGKALDLDKILSREEIERSKDLKNAIKAKIIKVIVKDREKENVEKVEDKIEVKEESDTKNIIQEEVSRQIKEFLNQLPIKEDNKDRQEILSAIQDLSKKIEQKSTENNSSEIQKQYIDTDESKVVDIHAKSMNRLLKKSKDDSSTFKTDVIKSKVDKNDLDDLANLI